MTTHEIPKTQTVAVIDNPGEHARMRIVHDAPVPTLQDGQVLIKLECTGVW